MTATAEVFAFKPGDLVLVKWNDSMVYFAKIKKIDPRRRKCVVVFDDKSQDEAEFGQIHSVDETTTDIICIKCKKDDSDSPNEIVLCDRCGIGYHQKCHSPPIPASALELDTPWNCAYCLRGTKCPYLTESLDVLQNLLSDEEGHSHDEMDSLTTPESDEGGEEFTTPAATVPQHRRFLAPPKPHKKRGRKPKVKRGPKPRDPTKSPLAADSVRFKKEDSVDSVDLLPSTEPQDPDLSPSSSPPQQREMQLRRKRPIVATPPTLLKRLRKSSVQSQTLSVTRILVPVHKEGSSSSRSDVQGEVSEDMSRSPAEKDAERGDHVMSSPKLSPPAVASSDSQTPGSAQPPLPPPERKPRSLRVSLNLPDEVEPGSHMEKVKKSQKLHSPKVLLSLPLWEDDLGPKTSVSSSPPTNNPPMKSPPLSGGKIINLVSQRQSPTESRSPTPKSEGPPLTPFTASALPLQRAGRTSEEEGERKRKSRDEDRDPVEDSLPKRSKPALKSPPSSPLDDVFASPVEPEAELSSVEPHTTSPSSDPPPPPPPAKTLPHEPSSILARPAEEEESQMEVVSQGSVILPPAPTTATPVGYGARPQTEDKLPSPSIDTPSVVTVQPLPAIEMPMKADTASPSLPNPTPVATFKQIISKPAEHKEGQVAAGGTGVVKCPLSQEVSSSVLQSQSKARSPPNPPVVESRVSTPKPSPPLSQTPSVSVASLSSRLPQSSGATAVSVITIPSTTPTSSGVGVARPRPTPQSKDSDIIITSVEMRPPKSSAGSVFQSASHSGGLLQRNSGVSSKQAPVSTALHARPLSFSPGDTRPRPVSCTRVTAKIADIQPAPSSQSAAVGVQQKPGAAKQQTRLGAGSGQTPASVVPVVATPTGYTQPLAPTGSPTAPYTIIPAESVVSGGQGVARSVPHVATNRAVKPGTLPIKDPAPAVHYIFEPLVPTASTPIIYSQTTGVPVGVTKTSSANPAVYHTEVVSSKPMPVTTTKPYAIVPAQPTASIEIQGIAVNQQGTPLISSPVQLGYGTVSSTPYIHTVVTPSSGVRQLPAHTISSARTSKIFSESGRILQQNTPLSHQRVPDNQATAQLEEIGKNISDAFASSSEQMLIAAFEDAWKKFQANGKRYQSASNNATQKTMVQSNTFAKSIPPPNAEVVSVPGTSSRLSLIRPTYSRSKMPTVQSTADQLMCVSPDTQSGLAVAAPVGDLQQNQQSVQILYSVSPQTYTRGSECPVTTLYAVAPNSAQSPYDHMMKHSHLRQGRPKTSQVQTSGIYVPAHGNDIVAAKQQTAVVIEQVGGGSVLGSKSVVQTPRSQHQIFLSERVKQQEPVAAVQHLSVLKPQPAVVGDPQVKQRGTTAAPAPAGKAPRQCALCAKEATYLCSGCHRIWYCGKDCQLKAWEEHSENCKS